jgi:anti-sigma factor RsiW
MNEHLDGEQLSRLLDGDLSLAERGAALDHLAHCPACAHRQSELVEVAALLRSEPSVEWTSALSEGVLARTSSTASPVRRARRPLAAGLIACMAATTAFSLVIVAPIGLLITARVLDGLAGLPPLGVASPSHVLVGLVVVALAAPLFLYPLARWR